MCGKEDLINSNTRVENENLLFRYTYNVNTQCIQNSRYFVLKNLSCLSLQLAPDSFLEIIKIWINLRISPILIFFYVHYGLMFLRKIWCCNKSCNTKFKTIYSWYTVYVNCPTDYCLRFNSKFVWINFFDIIHKKLHKRETKQYTSKKQKAVFNLAKQEVCILKVCLQNIFLCLCFTFVDSALLPFRNV